MIITLTGKPCSGKGDVGKMFAKKYGFKVVSTGDMFRKAAIELGISNILEIQKTENVKKIDDYVDKKTENLGKRKLKEDILIDSRMAWHFIPKSFKVFLDVDWNIAAERLLGANRETEKVKSKAQAKKVLMERWQVENTRYKELYNVDNLNKYNYNLVLSTDNKSQEEIVEIIYNEYQKFMQNA